MRWCLLLTFAATATPALSQQRAEPPAVRVYLLAGQSNMEGQAVVDLDHERH